MRQQFVVYNKTTGIIEGGCGSTDKEGKSSYATKKLSENENLAVLYLSRDVTVEPNLHKISDGKIVDLLPEELPDTRSWIEKRFDDLEKRIEVLEATKSAE